MPYRWTQDTQPRAERLHLWPHRSLTADGFVWFIGITAVALCLPLLPLLGSVVLWGIFPFLLLALFGVWYGIRRNQSDLSMQEVLTLAKDRMELTRFDPRAGAQHWEANPYWVEVRLHPSKGPVENYVTLRGGEREVEIGAFLSPDERLELHEQLQDRLSLLRAAVH